MSPAGAFDAKERSTWSARFIEALGLICGNEPPSNIVDAWFAEGSDSFALQDWAADRAPDWAQGIAVIDAAELMADQPVEGEAHEPRPDAPAHVPPAGGGEDKVRRKLAHEIALAVQFKDFGRYNDKGEWLCTGKQIDLLTQACGDAADRALRALSHRSASQATRDEVIEECARVAEGLPLTMTKPDSPSWNKPFDQRVTTAKDAAEAIRALKQEPASDGWLPIDSAPRDGTAILICGGTVEYDNGLHGEMPFSGVDIAAWALCRDGWKGSNCDGYDEWAWHKPTHWRPLPAPPRALKQGGQE